MPDPSALLDFINMAKFYFKNYSFLDLDPGLVGLSLAYSITLTGMFQYCVRVSAEVENLVSSYSTCGYEKYMQA